MVLFPYTRLLNRHGFSVLESWGFPEDGSSPTSRPLLLLAVLLLRSIVRTPIAHGDNLYLMIGQGTETEIHGCNQHSKAVRTHRSLHMTTACHHDNDKF